MAQRMLRGAAEMALLARPTSIYGAEPRVFMQTWTLSFSSTSLEEHSSFGEALVVSRL